MTYARVTGNKQSITYAARNSQRGKYSSISRPLSTAMRYRMYNGAKLTITPARSNRNRLLASRETVMANLAPAQTKKLAPAARVMPATKRRGACKEYSSGATKAKRSILPSDIAMSSRVYNASGAARPHFNHSHQRQRVPEGKGSGK